MTCPLDIAIATRQNWANLVSILEREGKVGEVLWVETPTARAGRWSQGSSEILRRRGWTVLPPLELTKEAEVDPAIFAMSLRERIDPNRSIQVHMNGGTKLMQAVLTELAGSHSAWCYVDGQRFHTRQGGNWQQRPLSIKPTLDDILLAYGFETRDPDKQRIQMAADLKPGGDLHRAFLDMQMRLFPDLSRDQHAKRWTGFTKNLEWLFAALAQEGHPNIPERLRAILMSSALSNDLFRVFVTKEKERIGDNERQIRSLWHSFRKNLEWLIEARQTWAKSQRGPSPAALAFEGYFADVLEGIRNIWGAGETLRNQVIFPKGSEFPVAELDSVWVLPGGEVAVFECKLGTQEDKTGFRITLRSRAKAYETALGIHARPFLVLPARPATNPRYLQPILQDMAQAAEDLGWKTLIVPEEGQIGTELEPIGELQSIASQLRRYIPAQG